MQPGLPNWTLTIGFQGLGTEVGSRKKGLLKVRSSLKTGFGL